MATTNEVRSTEFKDDNGASNDTTKVNQSYCYLDKVAYMNVFNQARRLMINAGHWLNVWEIMEVRTKWIIQAEHQTKIL